MKQRKKRLVNIWFWFKCCGNYGYGLEKKLIQNTNVLPITSFFMSNVDAKGPTYTAERWYKKVCM